MTSTPLRAPRYLGWLWLLPALIGGLTTLLIMVVLPPDRTIDGFGDFFFKLIPLASAVLTIAFFPRNRGWLQWLIVLGFLFYMGYIDSAYVIEVNAYADSRTLDAAAQAAQFAQFYRFTLFVNAFMVLFTLFAFRLGGGGSARTLKLGFAGILIVISGLNDLTFWAMYQWPSGRPDTFDWASHVIIFTGASPTLATMLIFVGVHLALIVGVALLPIQRWLDRFASRWQPAA